MGVPPVPKPPSSRKGPNRNLVIAIGAAVVVAAALIVGSIVLTGGGDKAAVGSTSTETTTTTAATEGGTDPAVSLVAGIPQNGTILGSPDTTVRLLQFEDLQCPSCKKYMDDVFPAVVEEYVRPGRARIDFRGLEFLGPDSEKALRIALAAGAQNKLWEVVGLFYEKQGDENSGWVTDALIDEILASVPGLDSAKVKIDAKSARVTNQIAATQAQATTLGVDGTPSFYFAVGVNRPLKFQPQSYTPEAFRPALDDAIRG